MVSHPNEWAKGKGRIEQEVGGVVDVRRWRSEMGGGGLGRGLEMEELDKKGWVSYFPNW